jgi:endonuclease/exonuclease/phosphatase family metal-dependent hydrolase
MQASFTLMSFNVRYATAGDGADSWVYRRGLVFDVVQRRKPDVLGVQEALASQVDELLVHLPGYSYVGVGRDDGKRGGEYAAVFYRRDRLSVVSSGTFWLSDTPEVVGSRSWGNTVVRICTWARFRDADRTEFTVFNAHLDHESQASREKSVELILSRLRQAGSPSVVMGDFNAGEENRAVMMLVEGGMVDTYGLAEANRGTFTGFDPQSVTGPKIDYIFTSGSWTVLSAGIDRTTFEGRLPSDHFPVWAVVRVSAESREQRAES